MSARQSSTVDSSTPIHPAIEPLDDDDRTGRSYVDFLDFRAMETTGGAGGARGARRRANAVVRAQARCRAAERAERKRAK